MIDRDLISFVKLWHTAENGQLILHAESWLPIAMFWVQYQPLLSLIVDSCFSHHPCNCNSWIGSLVVKVLVSPAGGLRFKSLSGHNSGNPGYSKCLWVDNVSLAAYISLPQSQEDKQYTLSKPKCQLSLIYQLPVQYNILVHWSRQWFIGGQANG